MWIILQKLHTLYPHVGWSPLQHPLCGKLQGDTTHFSDDKLERRVLYISVFTLQLICNRTLCNTKQSQHYQQNTATNLQGIWQYICNTKKFKTQNSWLLRWSTGTLHCMNRVGSDHMEASQKYKINTLQHVRMILIINLSVAKWEQGFIMEK